MARHMLTLAALAGVLLLGLTRAEICNSDVCEFTLVVSHGQTMTLVDKKLRYAEVSLHGDQLHLVDAESWAGPGLEEIDLEEVGMDYDSSAPGHIVTADGYKRSLILINGQFPGPALHVREGSQIVVHVVNKLVTSSVTVHWHGMRQEGTTWMDGTAYVTQCPIPARQTFTYRFIASPGGTHWYHSHIANQRRDGLVGLLVVHNTAPQIPNLPLMVYDWFHTEAHEYTLTDLETSVDGPLLPPSSALINGRGRWKNKAPLTIFHVEAGLQYRIRSVNSGADHPYQISVDQHKLEIVALDGQEIEPIVVDIFFLAPGERVDFIIKADQRVGRYWLRARTVSPPGSPAGDGGNSMAHDPGQHHPAGSTVGPTDAVTNGNHTAAKQGHIHHGNTNSSMPMGTTLAPVRFQSSRHNGTTETSHSHTPTPMPTNMEAGGHATNGSLPQHMPSHRANSSHVMPSTNAPPPGGHHMTSHISAYDALAIIAYDSIPRGPDPTSEPSPCLATNPCVVFNCPFSFPEPDLKRCILLSEARGKSQYQDEKEDIVEHMLNVGLNWGSSINSRRFIPPKAPLSDDNPGILPCGDSCDQHGKGCACTNSLSLPYNRSVQFVLSNLEPPSHHGHGVDHSKHTQHAAGHPIHIHGHNFAVVAQGLAKYDPQSGAKIHDNPAIFCMDELCKNPVWAGAPKLNLVNPPVKDTVLVPPGGFVVVRIRSDNPGHWLLHCHILSDQLDGMTVLVEEAVDRVRPPPPGFPTCSQFKWSQTEFAKYLDAERPERQTLSTGIDGSCDPLLASCADGIIRVSDKFAAGVCVACAAVGFIVGIVLVQICLCCRKRSKRYLA